VQHLWYTAELRVSTGRPFARQVIELVSLLIHLTLLPYCHCLHSMQSVHCRAGFLKLLGVCLSVLSFAYNTPLRGFAAEQYAGWKYQSTGAQPHSAAVQHTAAACKCQQYHIDS